MKDAPLSAQMWWRTDKNLASKIFQLSCLVKNNLKMPPSRIVDCLQILLWLLAAADLCTSQYSIQRQDPFALLFGTLQTYQRAACDGEELNLDCPANTTISIQFVQYGRTRPSSQVYTSKKTDLPASSKVFFIFYHWRLFCGINPH